MVYLNHQDKTATLVAIVAMIDVVKIGAAMNVKSKTDYRAIMVATMLLVIIETNVVPCKRRCRVVGTVETKLLRIPQRVHA